MIKNENAILFLCIPKDFGYICVQIEYIQDIKDLNKLKIVHMFPGFDTDKTMLRIGAMNLMLHNVDYLGIEYKDSLSAGNTDAERYTQLLIIHNINTHNRDKMDKKTLEFVTYCIGKLSMELHLSQKEVYGRLKRSGILYDYIVPSYDVLHTFSSRYLMEDITEYMKEKGVLPA